MRLTAEKVSKHIGKKQILKEVSLEMESGHVYGFVGRNGSGKTMLFRALAGLMKIDSGEIRLDDKVLHKDMKVLPDLGIVIENAGLYPELSGFDNLWLLAKIKKKIGKEEIREAIRLMGLDPDDKRPVRKYSLGMKQRIVLAQAIMEKPQILMLDEPTNSLDEGGVEDIRKLVKREKEKGTMVLLASHSKEDIDLLADKVYLVKEGTVRER
ncbi:MULTISPECIES: ABC transporter ATP-binding protein [Sellimonas]|uniref:ATP-binding cassette domain-containing protein n=1 Tax=Sellimonas caecigallum TaxID=2592333 RepID=A0ABS7L8T2_9FIRM|nr:MULTISPECIES: ATP-binding cassette domain-containing protein [Sellimonas]MBY0759363.1 ATP-binding cassette domain-containing protein [Sellimonas caecigallum]OUP00038.1 multidrug ABC transporter ATP-binding protein [Drancourtella sp. An210]OUP66301.1 multidrug ABC transporter ATP-binding protein [Drancourtella sp. An177]